MGSGRFQPFDSVLIANRGEIVARVARTARQLGLRCVGVHSDADRGAPHLQACDQVVSLGGERPADSYLDIAKLLHAAGQSGAQAVHPGYGFLSENADFAQAVIDAGLVWIGPAPSAMRAMGDKANARERMQRAGVPVLPGTSASLDLKALQSQAKGLGWPIMVKAAAGGGGRGMRLVTEPDELPGALASAQAEAQAAFGDGRLLLERALIEPRHVEVQILADAHGHVLHLGERDCSVQRRHQKLIEEAPSPRVDVALRRRMGAAAIRVAQSAGEAGYCGAGTVEFLLDAQGEFWFMEMNTRLQVEHPVTECLTGLDLVAWQFRVARGEPLSLDQDELLARFESSGHALEVRLCAEDPAQSHLPQAGRLQRWQAPEGVRVDAALHSGQTISPFYDSMLGKLIAHGTDRDDARQRMMRALSQTVCLGLPTNRVFLAQVMAHPVFEAGAAHTGFLADEAQALQPVPDVRLQALAALTLAVAPHGWQTAQEPLWHASHRLERQVVIQSGEARQSWRLVGHAQDWQVSLGEQTWHLSNWQVLDAQVVSACIDGQPVVAQWVRAGDAFWMQSGLSQYEGEDVSLQPASRHAAVADGTVSAPLHGRVVRVEVALGDQVQAGDVLLVLEAMKMEHRLCAPRAGQVTQLTVGVGQQVAARHIVAHIQA